MRYILILLISLSSAWATNAVYLANAAAGGNTGVDCADAKAYSYFNSSGNWSGSPSGIQIGPGTTVHVCGTITGGAGTDGLIFQGSGSSGNPVTVLFEANAIMQSPYWGSIDPFSGDGGAIVCASKSWITIDGGTNGVIKNTANGSSLANKQPSAGVDIDGCSNYEVKNLSIIQIYVHVQDEAQGGDTVPMFVNNANNGHIHNNTFSDGYQVLNVGYSGTLAITNFEFDHNTMDHGCHIIQIGDANTNSTSSGYKIHDNALGPHQTEWTQASGGCHGDGMQIIAVNSGSTMSNSAFYNNQVLSDMCNGTDSNFNCTGLFYLDGHLTGIDVYNNVFAVTGVNSGYEGVLVTRPESNTPLSNIHYYNNVVIGNNSTQSCDCAGNKFQGHNTGIVNENNIFINFSTSDVYLNGDATWSFASMFGTTDHNDYYNVGAVAFDFNGSTSYTLASWRTAGRDVNGSNGNPLLDVNYKLQAGSAAIGLGANLTGLGITALDSDKAAVARPGSGAWDAGAYQFGAPSVSITNLGSVIQSTPFVPAISLTNGSGNAAAFICVYMNGLSVQPNHCATSAPWNVNVFDGIPGDGQAQFQAVAYDYAWNILASSTIYTQQIRLNGLNNSIGSLPTSGSATLTPVQWNGHNFGGACGGFTQFDGRENQGTDDTWTGTSCGGSGQVQGTFKSYRLPNGLHGVHFAFNGDGMGTQFGGDPYIVGNTFTSGNVSGSNITLTSPQQHWLVANRPAAFSSTGTLPTDSGTSAPLLTGYLYCSNNAVTGMPSTTCPTNLVTAASVTNPTISITLSSMPGGLTAGVSKVNLHRFTTSASSSNTGICDGLYTIATIVSLTFTVTAPNCPTGSWGGSTGVSGTEVIINPYFANYVDNNTATFSYTPGGAALSMSSGGSGTHTVSYRMRPAYWGTLPFDIFDGYPVGFAYNTVVTANGAHSMELRPPYNYVHLCLTPTATCPSSISLAPKIANTDGSFTTIAANSVTYPYVDDGGFTSVASVNSTTGVITASNVGWGIVTETCATCDSGSSLPAVPITVQVENNATFAHFSKTSGVLTSYTPGQSFPPMGWWFLDPIYATTFQSDPTQRLSWMGPLMNDSGITAAVASAGPPPSIYDPNNTSCNSALTSADTLLQGFSQTYHIAMGYDFENIEYPAIYEGAIANATGYNRLTCLTNYITNLAALGMVHALDGVDEISAKIANLFPNPTAGIGSANFTGPIVVSSGTATVTTLQNLYAVWNQSTGQGSAVFYAGATNTCLNGWHSVASITTNGSGQTTAYTFATTCGNGTYNASTDASLTQRYLWSFPYIGGSSGAGGTLACVLPKFVGTNHASYQTWSQILDDNGNALASNTDLTSFVCNGTSCTVNDTLNAIPNLSSVHVMTATNTALNGIWIVSGAATNSFSIPSTVAAGTYNSSTDPNLTLSVDCALPNNYFTQIYSAVHAGANIPIFQPILGTTYGNTTAVKGWNASNLADGSLLYHASQCPASLGDDCSTWSTVFNLVGGVAVTNLNSRAFQSTARRDLVFAGIQYLRLHTGYLFDPTQDKPNSVYWRPETFISRLEWDKTNGISGYKINWFQSNNSGQYALAKGLLVGGQALGPEYPTDHVWAAISRDFRLSTTEQKYWLQPRGASPYLGPMLPTAVTYGPYGNSLKVVCLADVPLNISGTTQSPSAYAQTIDLSKINISGGREYKNIINGLTSYYVALVGNPTSDATDPCAAPGQVITYYAQPPGVQSDLQTYVFPQPTAFPGGATAAAVVVSEYPRLTMYDSVVLCISTGCPVPAVVPFWWHYRYADASGNIVGEGTPVERLQ